MTWRRRLRSPRTTAWLAPGMELDVHAAILDSGWHISMTSLIDAWQVHVGEVELEHAAVDARDVEEVVDEVGFHLHVSADHAQGGAMPFGTRCSSRALTAASTGVSGVRSSWLRMARSGPCLRFGAWAMAFRGPANSRRSRSAGAARQVDQRVRIFGIVVRRFAGRGWQATRARPCHHGEGFSSSVRIFPSPCACRSGSCGRGTNPDRAE